MSSLSFCIYYRESEYEMIEVKSEMKTPSGCTIVDL